VPTSNFIFLNDKLPELAALGNLAEDYVYADPSSCAVKLRSFAEKFVDIIYIILNLPSDFEEKSLFNQINTESFKKSVPLPIINLLHSLRLSGNKAAHGSELSPEMSLNLLSQAHQLAKWLFASYCGGDLISVKEFGKPVYNKETDWQKEKFSILKELLDKENQLQELFIELQIEREKSAQIQKPKQELEALLHNGHRVSNELQFSEDQTRRILIDEALAAVGWNVDPHYKQTEDIFPECPVEHQPTESGIGYADYVLFADGKPIAVIEAKKTSKDPKIGRKQAQLYADGLEKMFGQRPVIFYTNGFETKIWNDAAGEPPRPIYGFYSKDSLQYIIFQRTNRQDINTPKINYDITDRPYQIEAIKRVLEKFHSKRRKALVVQATGTGKTRVAISICDVLTRANWAKNILFLCDRRELRKQAKNTFSEFLPGSPLVILNASSSKERKKRIYLATYPAMNQYFQNFDPGFFDLIIADESHRSIYKAYSDLFKYFDCLQIGLTATPVDFVSRNTFTMFDCKPLDPTANYSYDEAISHEPPYLSRYEVFNVTTKFLREGIRYSQLTREQQIELEEQLNNPETVDFDSDELDKYIYNLDTNRNIIRNLMENGIKFPDGRLGKSIIFARSHAHAKILEGVFDELYPQYGGNFCQVIDNYDPRADQLIDDLKGIGNNKDLTIAISVDMLDTGIDIPELLNLVFAKPVKSYVKFWQMIGRGTRLCKDLFGLGLDKKKFTIFDHWGNFEWFDLSYKPVEPPVSKSLLQRLFEERILLAVNALNKFDQSTFEFTIELILKDISTLAATNTISVKEKIKDIKLLENENLLKTFSGEVKNQLRNTIAPLMQWINIRGESAAYKFDLLTAQAQNALLVNSGVFMDLKGEIINRVNNLKKNLNQVKAKSEILKQVLTDEYWQNIKIKELENLRTEIRSIMKFQEGTGGDPIPIPQIDVTDSELQFEEYHIQNKGMEMAAYKERVEDVLSRLFDKSETLKKIKSGIPVNDHDIQELISLVLTQHPDVNLELLREFYPDTAGHLDLAIRRVIGLDPKYLDMQFTKFIQQNHDLNPTQLKFIQMLQNHISKYGAIKLETLFEPPFTNVHSEGIYGVFPDTNQVNQIIGLVKEINYPYAPPTPNDE
jgi:type I restriction enzyme R subunit